MDISIIEPVFRLILQIQFGLLAALGLSTFIHTISLDTQVRRMIKNQREFIENLYEARIREMEETVKARKARIANMHNAP